MREKVKIIPFDFDEKLLLRDMIYHAIFVPPGGREPAHSVVDSPEIALYVSGWNRAGDMGFKAVRVANAQAVGACWIRLWPGPERGYGYVNEETPELCLAVLPEFRGRLIGTHLLQHMLQVTESHFSAVSLSVTDVNPAVRLYQRFGFGVIAKIGDSLLMVRNSS